MDENEEPRPSTSKQDQEKRSHKTNSNTDVDKQDDRGSSETSMSNTHSENSHVDMAHERPKAPTGVKKERKPKERKNRSRPNGRVVKRARRTEIRRPTRRSRRLQDRRKKRELSISTIFTPLSSSVSMTQGCPHCGHRCCRRRFYEMRKMRMRRLRNFCKKDKFQKHLKCMATQTTGSECTQIGSRCLMLSPLCLNTNASPPEPISKENRSSIGITPEMIYAALKKLTMWRQEANTAAILDDIKRSYPVGFGEGLLNELVEKLQIAAVVGIVTQTNDDCWCLSCALQQRKISQNHVTLFWKIYGDTMKPVVRSPNPSPQETGQDQQSNTVSRVKEILPDITYEYEFI